MLTMEHRAGLNPCSHTGQEGQAKVWGRGNKAGMVGLLGRSSGADDLGELHCGVETEED